MPSGRRRVWKILFAVTWLAGLASAIRMGTVAHGTGPEHLLGLMGCAYLAAWGPFFLLSGHDPAQKSMRFALCTGSIVSCVLAFEIVGAIAGVDYRSLFSSPTPPWRRPGNRPDPDLIFVKDGPKVMRVTCRGVETARMRRTSAWPVYDHEVRLDRNGFRNPAELSSADVAVIGDSFVEGLQVDAHELLTARLADRLRLGVVNLGRSGYGPQQELHVLSRYALGYRPKVCVWAFYEGNDLQDLGNYEVHRRSVRRASREVPSRWSYATSFTRNGLDYAIRSWIRPDPGLPIRLFRGQFPEQSGRSRDILFATGIQHDDVAPPLPRDDSPELRRFGSVLKEAQELCRRAGIRLVVAFIPAKFRVYKDLCEFDPESPCLSWAVDGLPCSLGKIVREVSPDIDYLDMTPRFIAEAGRGPLLYLQDDIHWSAEGHRLAAELLAEYLAVRLVPETARYAGSMRQGTATR